MENKVDSTDLAAESAYSKISEWLMNKLEYSLNALYLVSANRVQNDLIEKEELGCDKNSKGNTRSCTGGEVGFDDLEKVFQNLSVKNGPKEPTIVNDFNLIEKLDAVENKKQLYHHLKAVNEKLLKKKDKLLDDAARGSTGKFNNNFAKALKNVREKRLTVEEQENNCKAYAKATELLESMYHITCESCRDMRENNEIVQLRNVNSDVSARDVSESISVNSTIDGLSI